MTSFTSLVSPPTDFRSTLVFVDTDIRVVEFVGHVSGTSDTGTDTDGDNWVRRNIIQPDWFVVDIIDNLTG